MHLSSALITLAMAVWYLINSRRGKRNAEIKAAEEAAKIELMKNHPEVWAQLVDEDERKLGHRREGHDKIVSVAGPVALTVLQKLPIKQ